MQAGAEPDAALVDASRRGDRTAFTQVIERYQRAVYAVAFSRVRDHALSDDVTQDTFVAAWGRLGDLRDSTRLPAWLCGIARNLARDACKRRQREHAGAVPEVADELTPFDALSDADTERLITAALARVPDAYREPLVLFYYEQRSVEDVARTLGITARTTNKRLSRGRRYLAERVTAIVERGLGRRGPRADLAVAVLAAIGVLGSGSHVDASPSTSKGSTMSPKLALALVLAATLIGGASLLAADAPRDRPRPAPGKTPAAAAAPRASTPPARDAAPANTTRKPAPTTGSAATTVRAPAKPSLPAPGRVDVPDCDTVAHHMADISLARVEDAGPIPAAKRVEISAAIVTAVATACESEAWSEDHRVCIVDADDYDRARIDCTDDPVATPSEVAALPASLGCDVLAQHIHELANGPDGKYTSLRKQAGPDRAPVVDRLALQARADLAAECDQMPWSIERRRCVVASTTYRGYAACP